MAILGGSPLGLIGVRSTSRNGMSTFNNGASRNINVNNYNTGTDKYPIKEVGLNKEHSYSVSDINSGTRTLFTGSSVISPYGNSGKIGTQDGGGKGLKEEYKGIKRSSLHNNDIYDTSILNIVEKLSGTEAALRMSDFAYLKDLGVFPNNRLMIARRFISPHDDNIFGKGNVPMAVMISWNLQGDDFLDISFGEEWQEALADFTGVLNSLGDDFLGKGLGSKLGAGLNSIPLPGFTETIQRKVLQEIGVLDAQGEEDPLPSGNPNLIKKARRRKTVSATDAGSGLKCTVSIKMTCEWEQKFISGIDPTIAWQNIIENVLRFGTSRSDVFGLKPKFEKTLQKWMEQPWSMITDIIGFIKAGLEDAIKAVADTVIEVKKAVTELSGEQLKAQALATANEFKEKIEKGLVKQLKKYKIEIEGITRALSGAPSTPWHVTLGNPLRPIFCAGDMLVEDVKLVLGPTLAFNDLPSSIKAEFTLTNARPWGLQEIQAKFNSGSIRVSNGVKDSNNLNPGEAGKDNKTDQNISKAISATTSTSTTTSSKLDKKTLTVSQEKDITGNAPVISQAPTGTVNTFTAPQTPIPSIPETPSISGITSTKEGKAGEQIVSDPNSLSPTTLQLISQISLT